MQAPLVIVGTGLAGYNLAKEWRKHDPLTPLVMFTIEDGHFYSKPMLSTALAQEKTPDQLPIHLVEQMRVQLNARIETHTQVTHIEPEEQTIFFADQRIEYQQLVLALGATSIQPHWAGNGVPLICSINDLEDYCRFRKTLSEARHIGIIGSGLVGCEFANDLILSGYQVSVISLEESPLARLIPKMAGTVVADALEEKGVKWYFEENVQAVHYTDDSFTIDLQSGKKIICDHVLSACGLKPHTALAKQAGLLVHQGIKVSRYLQTSAQKIYALGDCAEVDGIVLQYVSPLMHSARALAKTLSGTPTQVQYPALPIGIKTTICPVLVCIPPNLSTEVEWQIEQQEGNSIKMTAWDPKEKFIGYVLTGSFLKERLTLTEQLPAFLPSEY